MDCWGVLQADADACTPNPAFLPVHGSAAASRPAAPALAVLLCCCGDTDLLPC